MTLRPPEIVAREMKYPRRDIWILLAVCGFTRLLMLPWNSAEYTDGVLQARALVDPVGIWPPLYSLVVYALKFLFGYMWAGRLVSAVASALAVWPIYRLTQRAFGTRAALYAGMFYIGAPVAVRWGVRVMTEPMFCLFFWWACERLYSASDERNRAAAGRALGWGAVHAVLASLTRYQGFLLVPPVLLCAWLIRRRFGRFPIKPTLWLLGLAIIPAWIELAGFIHGDQFAERSTGQGLRAMLYVLVMNAEPFGLLFPYWLTYPVFLMALYGAFWTRLRRGAYFAWLAIYLAVSLLVLQSLFSSFQERYFLPLMGFFWALAGSGMYVLQERWRRHYRPIRARMFPYLLIVVYGWTAVFSIAVFAAHHDAFGDIARASRYAGSQASEGTTLYTNEYYRLGAPFAIAGDKVRFFSKKPTVFLDEQYIPARALIPGMDASDEPRSRRRTIPPGSVLVLSSRYQGDLYLHYLATQYQLTELTDEPFVSSLLPLFPDIMVQPGTEQNPLAWHYRYQWQTWETRVFRVEGRR